MNSGATLTAGRQVDTATTVGSWNEAGPVELDAEIGYIPADEFDALSYSREELDLVGELTSGLASDPAASATDTLLGALIGNSAPLLTATDEAALFRRMNYLKFRAEAIRVGLSAHRPSKAKVRKIDTLLQEAEAVRRRIAESNIRLVASVSRKYSKSSQEFQEFVSEGLLILLGAIEKFDYSRGFRFSTYATHAVQRHLFRVSQRSQKRNQRFVLTPGEVLADVASADEPAEEAGPDPMIVYRRLMESAGSRLNEREAAILRRRFGTDGHGIAQTLREVAFDLGISKERVRQIQFAALEKLRVVADELNLSAMVG